MTTLEVELRRAIAAGRPYEAAAYYLKLCDATGVTPVAQYAKRVFDAARQHEAA